MLYSTDSSKQYQVTGVVAIQISILGAATPLALDITAKLANHSSCAHLNTTCLL